MVSIIIPAYDFALIERNTEKTSLGSFESPVKYEDQCLR